jgi:hypothetical protein
MRRVHLTIITVLVLWAICVIPGSAVVTLNIALTASPNPVLPGNQLTYTITATNTGDETSFPTFSLNYDPNLVYLSGSPLSDNEFEGMQVVNPAIWSTIGASETSPGRIIQISPQGTYVITVTTQVKPNTPCSTPIVSTATVSDSGDDHAPSVASATVTTSTPTCVITAPEFPSPAIPVTILLGLVFGILAIRTRVR